MLIESRLAKKCLPLMKSQLRFEKNLWGNLKIVFDFL